MKRVGMGIVGAGFVGPHHLDAVRRLGFVDVVGIAASSEASAKAKAEQLGVPKSYASYEALIRDPDIQVVHNTTPNYLHYPVNLAVIEAGKHIVSDKPLAMNAVEARKLLDGARAKGVVHAVTFNYRGNPLVQQMRLMIARGDIGRPHFVFGQYLQDWLLLDTDYSWRLEPDKGGASSALGDVGSHWCDVAQHVSGTRITEVLADLSTTIPKRKKPTGSREAFAAARADEQLEEVEMKVEDLATVLVRFDSGARGVFSVSQVSAGHKNDLFLEVNGATGSLRWYQEQQNELWIGRRDQPNQLLLKDPSLLDEPARRYAHLPGGHQEAWTDAFCNVMRDVYGYIAEGRDPRSDEQPPAFATFEDGYRANCLVDAMLESARAGNKWVKVEY
ncbi:MAG: gfo/Idh/MocA family oxidoreductase [Luteitalea sp.]|nr:gfo/Idh/MocA family oxidoreductase [Luteitalea sp.]